MVRFEYTGDMTFFSHFKKNLISLDKFLDRHCLLCFFLLIITVLRIPNFFEPYWYGDEGIYLTVGKGINYGQRLYADIVDHKTPLIYYLARVPDQLSFRILLYSWMIASTIAFYAIAKKLFTKSLSVGIALSIFVALTTLPWLEGNIPNGELFVIGFILVGAWILTKTNSITLISASKVNKADNSAFTILERKEVVQIFAAGCLFGLALLTKVPALFDAVAFFALFFFIALHQYWFKKNGTTLKKAVVFFISHSLLLGLGMLTPLLVTILYFYSIGAGADYLNFGLLYNFHYSGTWKLTFDSPVLTNLFTLGSKFGILMALFGLIVLLTKYLSIQYQFLATWAALALFASLLSNRPYPHYFLQLVPPFAFLFGSLIDSRKSYFSKLSLKTEHILSFVLPRLVSLTLVILVISVYQLLNFEPYKVKPYYLDWYQYITGAINKEVYYQRFNTLMTDNYKAAPIIAEAGDTFSFIWGTNPMLYALSDTIPAGRFTVSFHIHDLKNSGAFEETMKDIQEHQPTFVIIMNNEQGSFPAFTNYVESNYIMYEKYDNFTLYRKSTYLK